MVFVDLVTNSITNTGRDVQIQFKLHTYYTKLIMGHKCCYQDVFFQYCFSKVKKASKHHEQTTELIKTVSKCPSMQHSATQDINGSDYVVCAEGEKQPKHHCASALFSKINVAQRLLS